MLFENNFSGVMLLCRRGAGAYSGPCPCSCPRAALWPRLLGLGHFMPSFQGGYIHGRIPRTLMVLLVPRAQPSGCIDVLQKDLASLTRPSQPAPRVSRSGQRCRGLSTPQERNRKETAPVYPSKLEAASLPRLPKLHLPPELLVEDGAHLPPSWTSSTCPD